jgi:hypothetical protein
MSQNSRALRARNTLVFLSTGVHRVAVEGSVATTYERALDILKLLLVGRKLRVPLLSGCGQRSVLFLALAMKRRSQRQK